MTWQRKRLLNVHRVWRHDSKTYFGPARIRFDERFAISRARTHRKCVSRSDFERLAPLPVSLFPGVAFFHISIEFQTIQLKKTFMRRFSSRLDSQASGSYYFSRPVIHFKAFRCKIVTRVGCEWFSLADAIQMKTIHSIPKIAHFPHLAACILVWTDPEIKSNPLHLHRRSVFVLPGGWLRNLNTFLISTARRKMNTLANAKSAVANWSGRRLHFWLEIQSI